MKYYCLNKLIKCEYLLDNGTCSDKFRGKKWNKVRKSSRGKGECIFCISEVDLAIVKMTDSGIKPLNYVGPGPYRRTR